MTKQTLTFTAQLTTSVLIREGKSPQSPLAVLLHGYGQTGEDILKTLSPYLPSDWRLVAPDGPYPFFSSKQQKMVASWFFFDPKTRKYIVGRDTALVQLATLLEQYRGEATELYVIGFSQGAYMAPYLGLGGFQPRRVITLNGRLRHEDLLGQKPFSILSLNGEKDETVEVANCRLSADQLKQAGWPIDFRVIPDAGHDLNESILKELKAQLEQD